MGWGRLMGTYQIHGGKKDFHLQPPMASLSSFHMPYLSSSLMARHHVMILIPFIDKHLIIYKLQRN